MFFYFKVNENTFLYYFKFLDSSLYFNQVVSNPHPTQLVTNSVNFITNFKVIFRIVFH